MIRTLLMVCVLTVTALPVQSQESRAGEAPPRSQSSQPLAGMPAPAQSQQSVQQVAPDAAVVTIHGICPDGQGKPEQSDSCSLVLTRTQFETMVSSINVTNQNYSGTALRSLASGYVTVLSLASAGEQAGVEKDPRFQELMKVAHARALADAYRRYLQEKYGSPSAAEIEEYYRQNASKFEQLKIDRVLIPRVNPKRPQERRAEFEQKARELAATIRERASKGEDMSSLQVEAYKSLGLVDSQPPQTEMISSRKGIFQPGVEQEINALKPGEVTKVEFEPSGFNIYKLRSRTIIPLELAKATIVQELSQKNIDAALKSATSHVHADYNEQFFNPAPTGGLQNRLPARMVPSGNPPIARPMQPRSSPSVPSNSAPATNSSAPSVQKTTPPK